MPKACDARGSVEFILEVGRMPGSPDGARDQPCILSKHIGSFEEHVKDSFYSIYMYVYV